MLAFSSSLKLLEVKDRNQYFNARSRRRKTVRPEDKNDRNSSYRRWISCARERGLETQGRRLRIGRAIKILGRLVGVHRGGFFGHPYSPQLIGVKQCSWDSGVVGTRRRRIPGG